MKAVNPAVKIGVSGDDPAWLDAVLKEAGSHVDWISVSASPLESEPINRLHQKATLQRLLVGLRESLIFSKDGRNQDRVLACTSPNIHDAPKTPDNEQVHVI
jgi:hypothetical protein